MLIRPFADADEDAVVALWRRCGLTRPWNDPHLDIARKKLVQPELFLVAEDEGRIVGTAMVGYEGHRGWINYLAVDPACQRQGLGSRLMQRAEQLLMASGCPKLNLQVRADNEAAQRFYARLGYGRDEVVSMGKRLIVDPAEVSPRD